MSPRVSGNGQGPDDFDLDAAIAAAAEAAPPVPFRFVFKGEHFEIPPIRSWPLSVQGQIGEGQFEEGLTALLGEEGYKRLVDAGITIGGIEEMLKGVGKSAGVPNSSAPQRRVSTRR